MLRKNKKLFIASTLVTLLPVAAGLLLWSFLPEQIPTHWNLKGEIDGYSGKAFSVFGLTGIILIAHLICILSTAADPKHEYINKKLLTLVCWICPLLSLIASGTIYATALGMKIRMDIWPMVLIGILLIVIGSQLPGCEPNYTVGIKLPWTLHNEENWKKTHRFAGPVWVCGGSVILISSFFGLSNWLLFTAVIVALIAVPAIYSFILYQKSEKDPA